MIAFISLNINKIVPIEINNEISIFNPCKPKNIISDKFKISKDTFIKNKPIEILIVNINPKKSRPSGISVLYIFY